MGLPAAYDGRNFPSVFSDVHTRGEVQEAREKVQRANGRADRFRVIALLFLGALVLAGFGVYWAWNQAQIARGDATTLATELGELDVQLDDYETLVERRAEIAQTRETLYGKIYNQQSSEWRRLLDEAAQRAWTASGQTDRLVFTGEPPTRYAAQSWRVAHDQALAPLRTERTALDAVNVAVDRELARLRSIRPNPRPCPDARSC